MPLDPSILEELGRRRAEEHALAERDRWRALIVTALKCLGWMAAGLFSIGWSLHTTDAGFGRIAFLGGIAIGNGGVLYTLVTAYQRGEERGDW